MILALFQTPKSFKHKKERADPEEVFSDHKIVIVAKVTTEKQYGLDYMEQIIVMRENDKPYSFSEADFKYLNKNDIEDIVHDFQLRIESYQININLTAPTLTFPSIEACNPYSIVDEPSVCNIPYFQVLSTPLLPFRCIPDSGGVTDWYQEPIIMPPRRLKKKSVKRLVEKHVAKVIEEYEKSRANLDSAGSSGGKTGNTKGTVNMQGCSHKTFMHGKPHSFNGTTL
ncbi:hypothetical protein Tco_0404297 [Tanacetum coccineum]